MTRTKNISDSEVLRLAMQVIVTRGPDSFTLEDISKRVKLAPATLIQRFRAKDNLLLEAIKRDHIDFSMMIEKNLPRWEGQGIEGIIAFLSGMSDGLDSENLGEHIQLLAKDVSIPKLHKLAQERMELVRNTLRKLLESGQNNGKIKKDLSIGDCVYNLEALWHGSNIQWAFLKQRSIKMWVSERLASYMQLLRANSKE